MAAQLIRHGYYSVSQLFGRSCEVTLDELEIAYQIALMDNIYKAASSLEAKKK